MKTWKEVLVEWDKGNYPKMPLNIKKPFLWRTSVINNKVDLQYKEEYTEDKRLEGREQDYSPFLKSPSSLLSKKNMLSIQ